MGVPREYIELHPPHFGENDIAYAKRLRADWRRDQLRTARQLLHQKADHEALLMIEALLADIVAHDLQ